jgi:hypothetical protein
MVAPPSRLAHRHTSLVAFHPESRIFRMSIQDRIAHHADRAFEELDRARAAASPEAAIAHLDLSQLHLGRMKELSNEPRPALQLVSG